MAADAAPAFVLLDRLPAAGEELRVEGDEAHYLSRVVRARAGERVTATDGAGTIATLEVLESRPEVRLLGVSSRIVERPSPRTIWCGAPEGDRADWLVEKLAELSVAHLVLVDFERSAWERASARLERWKRLTAAGLRQSQSAFRMTISAPVGLPGLLAVLPPAFAGAMALPGATLAIGDAPRPAGGVTGVVGPSPGFSAGEVKLLQEAGFIPVSLGPSRLRTETAAMAMAVCWQVSAPQES